MHHRSRPVALCLRLWALWCGLGGLGVGSCAAGAAQQSPTVVQRPGTAATVDPQIPPAVDSDPVPAPDATPPKAAVPAPSAPSAQGNEAAAPAPGAPGKQPGAQTAPPAAPGVVTEQNGRYTLRTGAYEVRLNASVIDSTGRSVGGLTKDAFHVYEDGVPQTILGFRHEDLPVSLGILIDSSGSMYDKRASVDAASLDLVRLSNPQDEAFLVDFSSEAYIDQDFTNSIAKLQQGLSYVKSSGGTALYDAVIASADYLAKNGRRPKQVILLVTDGDDNASSATLEQAIRRVQELDGPAIYCIGLLFGEDVSRSESRHARQVLTEMAEQTGGQSYFPKSLRDVDGIAQEVAQDIRQQYTLEYRSTKPLSEGGYRQIHVEAREKGYRGLQVRTRAGYYPRVGNTAATAPAPATP